MRDDRRVAPWAIGLTLLALTLSPLVRPVGYDSFPFSSYPMFAHGRADASTRSHRAIGVREDGALVALPPRMLGSDEVLQADATLRQAIRRGSKAVARLCRQVARRVAADPSFADVVRVEVATEVYDAIAYFAGDTAPSGPVRRHTKCRVSR